MKVNSFLGFIDLSFGVYILTAIFSVFGVYSFLSNVFNFMESSNKIVLLIIMFSTLSMVYIWANAANGIDDTEKTQRVIVIALRQWSVFVILWILLFVLSKNSNAKMYVCLSGNCPESIWLYNNTWDTRVREERLTLFKDESKIAGEQIMSTVVTPAGWLDSLSMNTTRTKYNEEPITLSTKYATNTTLSINIIIIISSVSFFLSLFIYGWIILHSYNIELKHNPCFANKETNPPIEETPETA